MKRSVIVLLAACGFVPLSGCVERVMEAGTPPPAAAAAPEEDRGSRPTRLLPRFPDFGHLPAPNEYQGRIFRLSQDYPREEPEVDAPVRRILEIDFRKDWEKYITAVRDYIYEGNIEADGVAADFYLETNPVRRWYHVPWQHWGAFGREGIHGLTKEGPVMKRMLAPTQTGLYQTYAVGFYNPLGGWVIGQVWKDAQNPDLDFMRRNHGFPVGTVVGKVLFTTAPVAEVPYLTAPIEWLAYATPSFQEQTKRQVTVVRFIQMDIMVRDSRADDVGGWVFGTFVYNGALARDNPWLNVVPVGLQWGNDPDVTSHSESNPTPTMTLTNPDLKQGIINSSPDLPPMHLGFGLRLDGPVDNPMSSCMSCHSTAQFPAISPILPFMATKDGQSLKSGTPDWMRWFRNIKCNAPFDEQTTSTDYSLQLAQSIQNFLAARSQATGGLYSVQYWDNVRVQPLQQDERTLLPSR